MGRVLPLIFGCIALVGAAVVHAHSDGPQDTPEMLTAAVDVSVDVIAQ